MKPIPKRIYLKIELNISASINHTKFVPPINQIQSNPIQ